MQSLCGFCQAGVITLWPDGDSPNRRRVRYLIALSQRPDQPKGVLMAPTQVCLLHQIHRIKSRQLDNVVHICTQFGQAR